MRVNNQTSDPVDYEQNGGGPVDPSDRTTEACRQNGSLAPGASKEITDPCGPPFNLRLWTTGIKRPKIEIRIEDIPNKDAVVVLSALPVIVG